MSAQKFEKAELIKDFLPDDPKEMFDYIIQFNELMIKYNFTI